MPVTTYMQRHPRHDHGFTIPDPLLTKQFGTPNACKPLPQPTRMPIGRSKHPKNGMVKSSTARPAPAPS